MKLCSMTGGRLGLWRNKGRRDDRPFPPRQILPIAGFRGNRVMYGESWWTPEEEVDKGEEEDVEGTMMEGSYNPRALEPEEPVYSEPNFAHRGDGDELVPPHLSSPDSGYLSFGRPGLSSCSSDTEGSLASLAPGGGEPLVRLLPPYIPPPPPRAPSYPGPSSNSSQTPKNPLSRCQKPSQPSPQVPLFEASSSPQQTPSRTPQEGLPPPKTQNCQQTLTCTKTHLNVPAPASPAPVSPAPASPAPASPAPDLVDLSTVTEPLTEDLLLRLLQEHQQVFQGNIVASTVVPKLPDEGDHALLLRGQGAATATNSLLVQVASRLDSRGEEGAGDVVRAVAELLHLTGGQLACALMVAPGEIRIQSLSSRLCPSSSLFTEPQDLLPPVLRESLGLKASWGEETQVAAAMVSCLARLRVCPEDVLRLLAGVRLIQMPGQEREAEVVLGLEENTLSNCPFDLGGVASQLAARALGAVLRRAARLATSCLREKQPGTCLVAQLESEAENPYGEVEDLPHPSLLAHLASTCQFGFLLHLLALPPPAPSLHSLLSPHLSTTSVHCIVPGPRHHLAAQLRDLGLLELLHDNSGQLWQPLTLPNLLPLLSWLLPVEHQGGDSEQVNLRLLELLGAVGYQGGAVLEREIWQKLTSLREKREEAAAVILQRAWRQRRRMRESNKELLEGEAETWLGAENKETWLGADQVGQQGEVDSTLLGAEEERSLIETVLQKYERLQKQSESLAYSFYSDSSGYTMYGNNNNNNNRRGGSEARLTLEGAHPGGGADRSARSGDERGKERLHCGSTRLEAESRLESPATTADDVSLGTHLPSHHEPPLPHQVLKPEHPKDGSLFRAMPCTSMPCTSTPEPLAISPNDEVTDQIVLQTSQFFGLNLAVPPPLPPRRNYLVRGATKVFNSKTFHGV